MSDPKPLSGLRVVSFESRHAKTLADLIELNGGEAVRAPALKEVPLENNLEAFRFAEAWFRGEIDVLILLTGVGTRALVETLKTRWPEHEIFERLRRTALVPRGPKPIRVLNEWKIPFALTVPEPNTWRDLLAELDAHADKVPIENRTVAVQEYGVENQELLSGLKARGSRVMRVPVYRWALPDDTGPLEKAVQMILEGQAGVVMFTTAVQAEHVFQVADRLSAGVTGRSPLQDALKKTVVASVGPDTSEALRQKGIDPDLEPESPKMGPLVRLVAERARDILKKKRERL